MRIGILGTGDVGRALGRAFIAEGNEVKLGARDAGNEKANTWVEESGPNASAGTFADAAAFGEIVVIATLGMAAESAVTSAGVPNFGGKVVIDTTNPLDHSTGTLRLAIAGHDSLGERIQRLLPDAHVVKAFNTVGNPFMYKPDFPGGPPDMFICGNSKDAKGRVTAILEDFGWDVADTGGIESSRYLEAMCVVWVMACIGAKNWSQAFKMLRK